MPSKKRVAIIGTTGRGNFGHLMDVAWKDVSDRSEVVAVADADEKGRREAQQRSAARRAYADYVEMLDKEKPDIVTVGSQWPDRHAEMILAAVKRGCHVYLDKPFCQTLEEADRIVTACERTHAKLAVAHISRYCPILKVVQQMIADGRLGQVLEIRARGKEDFRGGSDDTWIDGSHLFNLMHVLAGHPTTCAATMTEKGHSVTAADIREGNFGLGYGAGDSLHARYEFKSGIVGYFDSVRDQRGDPTRFAVQIFGSRGVLEFPSGYAGIVSFLPDSAWSPSRSGAKWVRVTSAGIDQPEPLKLKGYPGGHLAATTDLLDAIEENRQPLCNVYEARTTLEFILGSFESHRQGGIAVSLPLKERRHPLQLMNESSRSPVGTR
jgi:predicted dehydrogenase